MHRSSRGPNSGISGQLYPQLLRPSIHCLSPLLLHSGLGGAGKVQPGKIASLLVYKPVTSPLCDPRSDEARRHTLKPVVKQLIRTSSTLNQARSERHVWTHTPVHTHTQVLLLMRPVVWVCDEWTCLSSQGVCVCLMLTCPAWPQLHSNQPQ